MAMIKRIVVLAGLIAVSARAQTVNCIAAVVNGEAVTLVDVHIVAEFGLGHSDLAPDAEDPRFAALDAIIDRKVVLEMARDARGVDRKELTEAVNALREELGEAAFAAGLRKFGLRGQDLEPYLEERILFDRAVALRFSRTIPVPLTEVEKFYRDVYSPEQVRRGAEPQPLDHVAALLESRIREEGWTRQVTAWIRDARNRADIQIRKDCLK